MAANKLFSLFDEKLRTPNDLVAGPSQNLDSVGNDVLDSDTILKKLQYFETVRPKVDYSDFTNFVFFNSALDYFNITGEKILNEYPFDGTSNEIEGFTNALDGYQKHVLDSWPKNSGHLRFYPPSGFSYVTVNDVGKDVDTMRTSMLSPDTGSLSVEFWALPPPSLTGSNNVMIVLQKVTGSGEGYSVFFSGSSAFMSVTSGSTTDQISVPFNAGVASYFCFAYDRSSTSPVMSVFTGSISTFPVLASSVTGTIAGAISAGSGKLYIGSGSLISKVVRPLTGSLDELRLWKSARTVSDISSSFNAKIYAQDNLYALWSFNESGSLASGENVLVKDVSGHRLNGSIQNYFSALRGSGSILPYDIEDKILSLNSPEVASYISEQQASGSLYDRYNDNIITRMLPEQFFLLEEFKNTEVLKNFLYVLGRYFDQIKVSIDQFIHVTKTNYGRFNQTPDALLQDVAKMFGWEFTGNFLDADVVQYLLGKQVLTNTQSNKALDVKLYEIKNEFWKRTLINLMHLYKTKGTKESVESLLRIYGLNRNFVRLKEFGYKPDSGIETHRIAAEKSVAALTFGSGSATSTNRVFSKNFVRSYDSAIETRVCFPTQISSNLTSSISTGSIWTMMSSSKLHQLYFTKSSATSQTGSLIYTGSEGSLSLSNVPIFDNRWCNVTVLRSATSSSIVIDVRILDDDEITYHQSASMTASLAFTTPNNSFWLGSSGTMGSQVWMQEARVWNGTLSDSEMNDHALNYQSFGSDNSNGASNLLLHWRLNENVSANSGGLLYNQIYDFSGQNVSGSGIGFTASVNPYKKFLNSYNYVASPEYGWNEEKIRSLDTSTVLPADAFIDNPMIALEFNLVDALNEDISQILSTLDNFNEFIGAPVNRYRDTYPDLDILRTNYFKRLNGSINFRLFADLLEFFDRSFIGMIRRLIPARAVFIGDEFVVESHMLERPKVQWNYRRREKELDLEGVIRVYIRS